MCILDSYLMPLSMGNENGHYYWCLATIVGACWHPSRYSIQYTVYIVYSIHCTKYNVHYSMYSVPLVFQPMHKRSLVSTIFCNQIMDWIKVFKKNHCWKKMGWYIKMRSYLVVIFTYCVKVLAFQNFQKLQQQKNAFFIFILAFWSTMP